MMHCPLESESEVTQLCLSLCDPVDTRLFRLWNFLGKSTGVGCHFLLQGIFPTQGSNPDLLHWRQMLYHLSLIPKVPVDIHVRHNVFAISELESIFIAQSIFCLHGFALFRDVIIG